MARSVLYFAVFIEIGRAMNLVYIAALRTAGDTVYPAIIAVISMFGIAVVLSYVFAITLEMGIVGVFLATMIDELFRGSMMALRWYRKKWTVLRLIEE
jgi:Na+-driven multidrug efflux pump